MLENLKSTASAANWLAAEETSYTCSELSLAEHSHLAGHLLLVMRWCPHESTKTSTAEHLASLLCSCLPEYTSPKIFTGYAGFCTIPEHTYLIQDLRCELPTPCFFSLVSLLYKLNPTVTKERVIDQVALYKDPPLPTLSLGSVLEPEENFYTSIGFSPVQGMRGCLVFHSCC